MIPGIIVTITAAFLFLYFYWKKQKDDYTQNQIFSSGFLILIGIALFSLIAQKFASQWTFWISFSGSVLGFLAARKRFRLKVWESLDAWVFGNTGLLIVFYSFLFIKNQTLEYFFAILVMSFIILLYIFLDKNYKQFSWYKSGRVGFTGLAVLGVFFIIRSVVAIISPNMIFFVDNYDVILSGVAAFISFLLLFNLSRREL